MFQLTPPHKGRLASLWSTRLNSSFNSRPRIRGDKIKAAHPISQNSFNSRPRIRGDLNAMMEQHTLEVSTHAPA